MADKTEIIYDLIFNTQAASKDIQSLNVQLKTIQDNMNKLGGAGQRAGQQVIKTGRAFGSAGQSIQNASFQVADFATQINGGIDATRALSQQIPQLLGGFGALGAGVGAAVAILVPLAAALGESRDYAKELADATDKLDAAQKISKATIVDLVEEYGRYTGAVRAAAKAQEELASLQIRKALVDEASAASELSQTYIGTAGAFGELANQFRNADFSRSVIGQWMSGPLDEAAKKVNFLKDKFSLTEEAAQALNKPFFDFESAVRNLNTDAAQLALKQFAEWVTKNKEEASTALPLLEALQKRFDALAKVRPVSAGEASSMGFSFTPRTDANSYSNYKGNAIVAQQLADIEKRDADAKKAIAKAASDAAAAQAKLNSEYERFIGNIDKGVTPLQKTQDVLRQAQENFAKFQDRMSPEQIANYTAYIEDLNKKIAELTFKDRWEEMAKGIQSVSTPLSELYAQLEEIGKTVQDSLAGGLTDAFMSFIEGTKSAQEAMKEFAVTFLKEITAMIIKSLILYAIQSALGMVGGGGGISQLIGGALNPIQNAKGNAFRNGRVMAFASGGVVNSPTYFPMAGGQTGLMGEAGPEAIVPLTRRNGKLGVSASPVNVTVINNSSASVSAKKTSDGGVSIEVVEDTVANLIARGGNKIDSAMARGYGLRRAGR